MKETVFLLTKSPFPGGVLTGLVRPESWSAGKLGNIILWSVIIGGGTLAAFYLLH